MGWEISHYVQLIIALCAGLVVFASAYALPARAVMWALLLLIPFQPINSAYGTINMVLTYMVGAAFLFRGRFRQLPLLGIVAFILLAYLMSFSQILPGTVRDHGLYIMAVLSNFIVFYLVYNYVRASGDCRDVWTLLAVLNVLVLIYCGLEMTVGIGREQLFGIEELTLKSSRAAEGRLSGPFGATAMTAEYLGIQSLLCAYALMRKMTALSRLFWWGLLAGNLGFMIATGNRGGVVSLAVGLLAFLVLFRKELGVLKFVAVAVSASLVFAVSAFVIVQYTQYNVLFERLEGTEFKGYVPDTRVGWYDLWDRIVEKPVIGHGPRMRLMNEETRYVPGYKPLPYPHNAYLFLIYTVGFVGLLAYIWFFSELARQYWRSRSNRAEDPLLRGMPRLGLAILVLFAVSEARMEMFRENLTDYQQYLFMLVGAFLAFSHLAMSRKEPVSSQAVHKNSIVSRGVLQKKRIPSGG
ncbi:MAG: O-antigen ligase family protein [Sulfuricaulis sp.]|uniref:O-antigen ligase family protein n=1 Tax=Sulfuricaulis sp. TaxID=2003553 RepID=UPI0025D3E614|nr:O-antigen ligase family protein [Sulfuricaulis sp.]MCR4347322.1 O-antigen ligase family protein [Sulfuricaulis sp.]